MRLRRLGVNSVFRFQYLVPILASGRELPNLFLRIPPCQKQVFEFATGFNARRIGIQTEIDFFDILIFLQELQHGFGRKPVQRDIVLFRPIFRIECRVGHHINCGFKYAAAPAEAIAAVRAGYCHTESLHAAHGRLCACGFGVPVFVCPDKNNVIVFPFLIEQMCIYKGFYHVARQEACFQQVGKQPFHVSGFFRQGEGRPACLAFLWFMIFIHSGGFVFTGGFPVQQLPHSLPETQPIEFLHKLYGIAARLVLMVVPAVAGNGNAVVFPAGIGVIKPAFLSGAPQLCAPAGKKILKVNIICFFKLFLCI